ncbi:MAG: single-stranded DNA-binding protein [Fimbriimonadia bacterium]|nr:single-stranded DNA-binding protein [Fimbriimonadia bacterium]
MNFNRVTLIGRLTRDPETRATADGMTVVKFTVAVSRYSKGEESTDFFDVVAFKNIADYVANYAAKGRLVLVEGSLQTRKWTAQDGTPRRWFEVLANTVKMLDRSRESMGGEEEGEREPARAAAPAAASGGDPHAGDVSVDDIPEDFEVDDDPFKEL